MTNNRPGMTSQEAAALYLSEGHTTDPALASMLDYAKRQPELLIPKGTIPERNYEPAKLVIDDPDEKERQRLRNAVGFDYEVTIGPQKATVMAVGTKLKTIARLSGDEELDSAALAKAVIRLKDKHTKWHRNLNNLIERGDA